jgi:hypothetical protein
MRGGWTSSTGSRSLMTTSSDSQCPNLATMRDPSQGIDVNGALLHLV